MFRGWVIEALVGEDHDHSPARSAENRNGLGWNSGYPLSTLMIEDYSGRPAIRDAGKSAVVRRPGPRVFMRVLG